MIWGYPNFRRPPLYVISISVSRPGHLPFFLLYPQVLQALPLVSWMSWMGWMRWRPFHWPVPHGLGCLVLHLWSLLASLPAPLDLHGINHASEASTHTRGTSIITGMMMALH